MRIQNLIDIVAEIDNLLARRLESVIPQILEKQVSIKKKDTKKQKITQIIRQLKDNNMLFGYKNFQTNKEIAEYLKIHEILIKKIPKKQRYIKPMVIKDKATGKIVSSIIPINDGAQNDNTKQQKEFEDICDTIRNKVKKKEITKGSALLKILRIVFKYNIKGGLDVNTKIIGYPIMKSNYGSYVNGDITQKQLRHAFNIASSTEIGIITKDKVDNKSTPQETTHTRVGPINREESDIRGTITAIITPGVTRLYINSNQNNINNFVNSVINEVRHNDIIRNNLTLAREIIEHQRDVLEGNLPF